jgi:hypothetical protein
VPVPLRATVLGLPVALCVIVNVESRVPVNVGVNFTVTVQVDPPDIVAGDIEHVVVDAKSPVTVMPEMVKS